MGSLASCLTLPSCESLSLQEARVRSLHLCLLISESFILKTVDLGPPAPWVVCACENLLICLKQPPLMLFK